MASGAVAVGCKSRRRNGWEFLDEEGALTLAGICDQIIPADDYPSASQAGVLIYIDRQLTRHYAKYQNNYIGGLKMADDLSLKEFGRRFALIDSQGQHRIVTAIESTDHDFFEMVRNHTLEGYYGAPRHGGNRDAVSWRMLGLAEPPLRGTRADHRRKKCEVVKRVNAVVVGQERQAVSSPRNSRLQG